MSILSCRRFLLFLPLLALLASCSEDFKVDAPYKHVTIVYGLMNSADTAHYIRIQKAYLDESKSALDIAKQADSNFYDSLVVRLQEMNNGTVLSEEMLRLVDLNAEGYKKDSAGVFFNAPNYAYKSTRSLNSDYRYRLIVMNKVTQLADTAETGIISNAPGKFQVLDFVFGFILRFPAVREGDAFKVDVTPPDNAQIFEGTIRFHYVDKDLTTGKQTDHSLDWIFATTQRTESKLLSLSALQRSFYSFLQASIPDAPANIARYMDTAEVFIWAGSPEFATYQQINGAQGGLTADQIKPIYTNIKGKDVYGLFASRAMRTRYAPVDDQSLDSVKLKLPRLNFRGRSDH